jgi:hypothetical protein
LAIFLSIVADGLASALTIIKSYHFPETENIYAYLGSGIAALITIATIRFWRFELIAFPFYIFVVCLILVVLIRFKIGKRFAS